MFSFTALLFFPLYTAEPGPDQALHIRIQTHSPLIFVPLPINMSFHRYLLDKVIKNEFIDKCY